MSQNNWLERDPKDSPGLQRIREAQQAATLAKTQEAQRVRQAEMAKIEAEQKRLEMIARIEQKTAQVLPLLKGIKDFVNQTGMYPLGPEPKPVTTELNWLKFSSLEISSPLSLGSGLQLAPTYQISDYRGLNREKEFCEIADGAEFQLSNELLNVVLSREINVIENASITVGRIARASNFELLGRVLQLGYGYKGYAQREIQEWSGKGEDMTPSTVLLTVEASVCYGIKLRIDNNGELEIRKQKTKIFPAQKIPKVYSSYSPEHEVLTNWWEKLSSENSSLRISLAEAFHNPVYLGVGELPRHQEIVPQPELGPQESTGIGSLVKGFLGIK